MYLQIKNKSLSSVAAIFLVLLAAVRPDHILVSGAEDDEVVGPRSGSNRGGAGGRIGSPGNGLAGSTFAGKSKGTSSGRTGGYSDQQSGDLGGVMGDLSESFSAMLNTHSADSTNGSETQKGDETEDIDIFKHVLNPVEFVKAISAKFRLHFGKFSAAIGKPLVFGIEAALTPFAATIRIVEKVFTPDTCRLQFVCKIGSKFNILRQHVSKFSPKFSEGSSLISAFGDGILGCDCASKFPCESGHPHLKEEYSGLKKEGHGGSKKEDSKIY